MSEVVVLRLHGPAASAVDLNVEWLTIDSSTLRHGKVQSGTLAQAAGAIGTRRATVLVPGADILLAEPVLPLKSSAKLAQVVPFALEEQLAADVEDLHFAVGKRDSRPGTPVAVVSHEKMSGWIAALTAAGIHVDALVAETAGLPITPNGVTLLIDASRVYVRREASLGAVLEIEPLIEALQLALASGDEAREHVTIYVAEADYERERDLLEGLREFTSSLQLKLLPEGPLPLLAAHVLEHPAINLLQGQYATKTRLNVSFAPWRYAAILAVVFVTAHAGLKTWQYIHFKDVEAQLDEQIAAVFQQAMPGAPLPAAGEARKQMESRLSQLRGSAPVSGMMTTLVTLGEAMAQAPGADIEALVYRDNTTDLRILAPSVDVLDRIRQVASERGVAAEIQSANPRDSKFEGRMQFKNAGA